MTSFPGIIDGDFLPDIPTKLMERGEYNHVDVMIGMTKDEGLLQSVQFEINPDLYDAAKFMWDNLGPMFLFGRVLPYDRWPDDIEKTNIITQVGGENEFYLKKKTLYLSVLHGNIGSLEY